MIKIRSLRNYSQRLDGSMPLQLLALSFFRLIRFIKIRKHLLLPKSDIGMDFLPNNHAGVSSRLQGIIVVDIKDFGLLNLCVSQFEKCTRNFQNRDLVLVTPSKYLSDLTKLKIDASLNMRVISDEEILSDALLDKIRSKYKSRAGWVIQQVLKLEVAYRFNGELSLVLDADTLLIKERFLFDEKQRSQVLFPSLEYHQPYYDFLLKIGALKNLPNYSFVTHHMIIQKDILEAALRNIGCESPLDLIQLVIDYPWIEDNSSPFSLDYELYAQFLVKHFPERYKFSRWANFELDSFSESTNFPQLLQDLDESYASISAHSYNLIKGH